MVESRSRRMEFVDLGAQRERISAELKAAIDKVLAHGRFIMGPEVLELEDALCRYTGTNECISCSSGTDAILMVLLAWDIGPGDVVFVPSFTFASTAEVVALIGATPVFVDVDEATFNIDPNSLAAAIEICGNEGLRPSAVIGVDLFGLPADWASLRRVAEGGELRVLADAAQSFGGRSPEGRVGNLADATTTSFFPAKPLGCYGDGGAIFTNDSDLAEQLRSVRVHGQGRSKYENVRIGINGRLDTIQAAILLEKLKTFDEELAARRTLADRYSAAFDGPVTVPEVPGGFASAWAQYTVRVPRRDEVRSALSHSGIPTAVYYPKPLHLQPAFARIFTGTVDLNVSEMLADEVLSLPIHPYLSSEDQTLVIEAALEAVR